METSDRTDQAAERPRPTMLDLLFSRLLADRHTVPSSRTIDDRRWAA